MTGEPEQRPAPDAGLEDLRWYWGDAYEIETDGREWQARRRGGGCDVIVYLWDAGHWTGICHSRADAQAAAASRMDGAARVEAARLAVDRDLTRVYERLGRAWTACRAADGTVTWEACSGSCHHVVDAGAVCSSDQKCGKCISCA